MTPALLRVSIQVEIENGKEEKMKRKHALQKWYIEPLDARTNEILARNQQFLSEEQILDGVWCSDGKSHRLWGCTDYAFVSRLIKSKAEMSAAFKVWHREGQGKIRPWDFPKKKGKRKEKSA